MKIICTIDNEAIKKAVEIVNLHYGDHDFLCRIAAVKSFNHTMDASEDVARKIRDCSEVFYVVPYRHWYPLSKTIGHFEKPNYRLNTWKLNSLTLTERVRNIFHECCGHGNGYSHKGNRITPYNKLTVPYLASDVFVDHLKSIGVLP